MVSAARAQYLKPTRGFQSNCFALSVNSFEVMGRLPRLKLVLSIFYIGGRHRRAVEGRKKEERRSTQSASLS